MKQTQCKMIQFRPAHLEERDSRTYSEMWVKKILYAFVRDYERRRGVKPMRADALKKFIESAFDF